MKTFFSKIILNLFLLYSLTYAQWVQIGNSSMAQSTSICIIGDYIFVGTAVMEYFVHQIMVIIGKL